MSQWGTADPVIWIRGVQYPLPTPEVRGRKEWEDETDRWTNLHREIQGRRHGFRKQEDWTFAGLDQDASAVLLKLVNAGEAWVAPWGVSGPRFWMKVIDHEDFYVEDKILVDGAWILLKSQKLYPKKIGPQEFYRGARVGRKVIVT